MGWMCCVITIDDQGSQIKITFKKDFIFSFLALYQNSVVRFIEKIKNKQANNKACFLKLVLKAPSLKLASFWLAAPQLAQLGFK